MTKIKRDRLSVSMMALLALGFVVIAFTQPKHTASGQYGEPVIPPTVIIPIPPPPTPPFSPPVVVPTDVTHPTLPPEYTSGSSPTSQGVSVLSPSAFPSQASLKGSTDFIETRVTPDTVHSKLTAYSNKLESGTMLVGVKKPSEIGLVEIPLGSVAVCSNADVLIISSDKDASSYEPTPSAPPAPAPSPAPPAPAPSPAPPAPPTSAAPAPGSDRSVSKSFLLDRINRIINLDGTGQNVKVNLNKGPFADPADDPVFALAPGYELVASSTKLKASDIRPNDGFARRNSRTFGKGNIAVSQISVESVLRSSSLVASMNQKDSGAKDRRILADMSKMAAVLNQVNGTYGYKK